MTVSLLFASLGCVVGAIFHSNIHSRCGMGPARGQGWFSGPGNVLDYPPYPVLSAVLCVCF